MSELAIETQSLHKHFGTLHAVDGLDMHVPCGSIYGFIGRNGAGKTTTIRMFAGLARSTSGQVRVLNLDPRTDGLRLLERTGFVIGKALLPSMTGHDLVRFNRGFFPRWSDAQVDKYVGVLEIPMNQRFQKLSTGNQTKLCMLLALSQGAELLILDEPTAGLDPFVTDQLLRVLVEDFANEGRTLFLSSHHLSASSAESVGGFRFGQFSKRVIECHFHRFEGTKSVRPSGYHTNFVIEALDRAA